MEKKTKIDRRQALKVAGGAGLGALLASLQLPGGMAQAASGKKGKKGKKAGAAAVKGFTFHHVGIPTQAKHENESFLADSKVYVTDPEKDPFHIEWCRWLPDSPSPEKLRTTTHVAFKVEDVEKELAKYKPEQIFAKPFEPFAGVKVAFIEFEGMLIEFLQKSA